MSEGLDIRRAVLHILDKSIGVPLLSEELLDLYEIEEFVERHILKSLKDEDSKIIHNYDGKLLDILDSYEHSPNGFLNLSKEFASMFYNIISKSEVPSADLLVIDYLNNEERNLMILKLNYKKSYIHYVEKSESLKNKIICQPVSLPNESQKIDEFINFNTKKNIVTIKEKKYDFDGISEKYISKFILEIAQSKSPKENLNLVKNAVDKVIKKYYPDDFMIKINTNDTMAESFNKERMINVDNIAEQVSKGIENIREDFLDDIKMAGITKKQILLNDNLKSHLNKKQRIITEDGIEVKVPINFFKMKDKYEIINNPDGTLSILIKNIEII